MTLVDGDEVKAHHEAGHVVVGSRRFGIAPLLTTIDGTLEFEGRTEWGDLLPRVADRVVSGNELAGMEHLLDMVVAGEVAARRFAPNLGYWGEQGDLAWATRIGGTIALSTLRPTDPRVYAGADECADQIALAKVRVHRLLEFDGLSEPVRMIAQSILADRSLEQNQLSALLKSAGILSSQECQVVS